MLEIRLLGECAVLVDGEPVRGIDSPRLQALITYLVIRRGAPCSRRELAFRLWPDSREAQARTNLRQLLFHLRRLLPGERDLLGDDTRTVLLRPDATVRIDVAEFERLLDGGQKAEAVALYRGALSSGCYEDWIDAERTRLAQRFARALAELADDAARRGDHQAVADWARRRVQHDPLDEAASLQLMRASAATGNRAEALKAFHACSSALARELGVEPGAPMAEAHERLFPREEGQPPVPPGADHHPLFGRRRELERLASDLEATRAGRPSVAVLFGEPGIGKSRLAQEVRLLAGRRGFATAWSRAYPTSETLAYAPVSDWLRSAA
ncbi:MAG TPA: BTAD domain-containing putative transcriptional regulator, partial [Kofleriaceae bacterium]